MDTDLPLIVSNYRVLLCDEGLPILFTGTNRYGTYIIGSSVDENYENGVERYFHILVEKTDYLLFSTRKVSYLELLRRAKPIFTVDKLINRDANIISQINFDEIPDDYRPSEQALYPVSAHEPTYKYSTSLIGGLADTNHAVPEDVSETQNSIAEAIDSAMNTLKHWLGVEHQTLLQPTTAGSFTINYEVRLKDFPSLFHTETEYLQYLNDFLAYCFDDLPEDSNQLANLNIEGLEGFNNLIHRLYDLNAGVKPTAEEETELKSSLIQDITETSRALQTAAKVVGKNYKSLAVTNLAADGDHALGIINEDYQRKIKDTVLVLNESVVIKQIEARHDEVKEYTVHVFDFNKNKGTGWGYMLVPENETNQQTVRITVTPYEPISPSIYTTSLDQNKFIKVRGVLKKTGRADRLEIKDESAS